MRAGEFVRGLADEVEQVAWLFKGHIYALSGVVDGAERGYEQRGDDGQALAICSVFVVEAVFAGNKGDAEAGRRIVATFDGAYQHSQLRGVGGIAPAEIIQDGGAFDVST